MWSEESNDWHIITDSKHIFGLLESWAADCKSEEPFKADRELEMGSFLTKIGHTFLGKSLIDEQGFVKGRNMSEFW